MMPTVYDLLRGDTFRIECRYCGHKFTAVGENGGGGHCACCGAGFRWDTIGFDELPADVIVVWEIPATTPLDSWHRVPLLAWDYVIGLGELFVIERGSDWIVGTQWIGGM